MGTNLKYYTVYGTKVDSYDSDLLEELYDQDIDHVADGMMGEYVVYGEIMGVSHDFRYEDGNGDNFFSIDISTLPEVERKYKEEFKEKFPDYFHMIDVPFKLYTFLHYS